MIVLDASAAVDLFRRAGERAEAVGKRIGGEFAVHVPGVFDLEVLQAFRGLEAARKIDASGLSTALGNLRDLRAVRHGHVHLRERIWALRKNLSAYDAAYVALAELLDATLVTGDRRLSRSSGHDARIELV